MNKNSNKESSGIKNAKSYVLIFLLAVLCCYAFLSISKNDGQTLPMIGGKGCAVVMTGSMEPNLPVDALVFVSECENYEKNDIVVIQDGYSLVVHRIIAIDESAVVTKGDANNTEDAPAPISHIKGKVTGYIPYAGAVVRFMKTPYGSLSVIAVVILLWLFSGKKNKETTEICENCRTDEVDENSEIRKEIEKLKAQIEERKDKNTDN